MSEDQLTRGAIAGIDTIGRLQKNSTLQIIQILRNPKGTNKLSLSDGVFCATTLCLRKTNDMVNNNEIKEYSIITVTGSTVTQTNTGKYHINMTECEVVQFDVPRMFGTPKPWAPGETAPKAPAQTGSPTSLPQPPAINRLPQKKTTSKANFTNISDVDTYTINFTLLARIMSMDYRETNTRDGRPLKILTIILSDKSSEIQGTFFNEEAEKFRNMLEKDKVYAVTGGKVKYANKFNKTKHQFEISFDRNTRFELNDDPSTDDIGQVHFTFVKLSEVSTLPVNKYIDIVGYVTAVDDVVTINKRAGGTTQKRSIQICDQSGVSVELTLWGEQADAVDHADVAIAVKEVRVTEFNGKKQLNTSNSSVIKVETEEVPQTLSVKAWYESDQRGEITEIASNNGENAQFATPTITFDMIDKDELGVGKQAYFIVYADLLDIYPNRVFYNACPNEKCKFKGVKLQDNGTYFCDRCQQTTEDPIQRYSFTFRAGDSTGTANISALGDDKSTMLIMDNLSPREYKDVTEEMSEDGIQEFLRQRIGRTLKLKIRASQNDYQGKTSTRLNLVSATVPNFGELTRMFSDEIDRY